MNQFGGEEQVGRLSRLVSEKSSRLRVERDQRSQLTVGEIARESPHDLIRTAEWAKALSTDAQRIIAAGTRLRITRA